MQEAMRTLREGGPSRLPAISRGQMPHRRAVEGEKKARRRPGSIGARAETPTEVREAAARESEERLRAKEKERAWDKARRPPKGRGGKRIARGERGQAAGLLSAVAGGEEADEDRREEAEVALRMLDLHAEARQTEMSLQRIFTARPQGLFDRELTVALGIAARHNELLKDYAKRCNVRFEEQTSKDVSREADEEASSVGSLATGVGRARRKRREERLAKLVEEAVRLREQSLMVVRRGGGAACRASVAGSLVDLSASRLQGNAGETEGGTEPSQAGRRALLLLHGLLSAPLDETASPELADGARAMRKQLDRMHRKAILENEAPTIQAFRRTEEMARRRARRRERMWNSHVSLYHSMSGSGEWPKTPTVGALKSRLSTPNPTY